MPVAQTILDDLIARYGVDATLSWDATVSPAGDQIAQVEINWLPRQYSVISIRSDYWSEENEDFLIATIRHEYAHVLQADRMMRYSWSHLTPQYFVLQQYTEYLDGIYGTSDDAASLEREADAFAQYEGSHGSNLGYSSRVYSLSPDSEPVFPARSHEALGHLIDGSLMP